MITEFLFLNELTEKEKIGFFCSARGKADKKEVNNPYSSTAQQYTEVI